MNLCFLIGKIISDIEYKFIINSKNDAVSIFEIELENNLVLKVKAYNELADFCYSKLNKNGYIGIQGYISTNGEIIVENIEGE